MKLEKIGSVDPVLKASLDRGEVLFCESGAMVAMDATLSLSGKARGGFFSSIGRKLLNDETFFQQQIEAKFDPGTVLLSPTLSGDILILDVGPDSYTIADGSYLASSQGVDIVMGTQGIGKALFAGTGDGLKGFFTVVDRNAFHLPAALECCATQYDPPKRHDFDPLVTVEQRLWR